MAALALPAKSIFTLKLPPPGRIAEDRAMLSLHARRLIVATASVVLLAACDKAAPPPPPRPPAPAKVEAPAPSPNEELKRLATEVFVFAYPLVLMDVTKQ